MEACIQTGPGHIDFNPPSILKHPRVQDHGPADLVRPAGLMNMSRYAEVRLQFFYKPANFLASHMRT